MATNISASSVNEAFEAYRETYPERPPSLAKLKYDDELHQITSADGLLELSLSPMTNVSLGPAPRNPNEAKDRKYLWVVANSNLPVSLENGPNRAFLSRKYLSHTNLTGGGPAHSGGELWFEAPTSIVINGGSSRYTPRGLDEVKEVAGALKACGYEVAHMGWDDEAWSSDRFLRGEPIWI